ncbi:MAG: ribosome biogenesis GTPase YlqF [Oscillospiraceae bacterium]|nr:ribosome biogenesis GTPase YlqF [Oscillospiraceae bacterium]
MNRGNRDNHSNSKSGNARNNRDNKQSTMNRKRLERSQKRQERDGSVSEQNLNIHWFPGHMTKALRQIEKELKLIDVFAEITDARLPESGRNPLLSQIVGDKPHILLLNKRDYASPEATKKWLEHYKSQGIIAISCDCRSGAGLENLPALLKQVVGEKKYGGAIRVMAAGIPNSGKSSFINRMAGGKKAAVGDRPGITRGKQWVKIDGGKAGNSSISANFSNKGGNAGKGVELEILDLPGILSPKLENKDVALRLAYTGAVKDEVMDVHGLAMNLAEFLYAKHKDKLIKRYNLDELLEVESEQHTDTKIDGVFLLKSIAKSRSMKIAGGELDTERAALALLDDFRGCKIGRITLEFPSMGDKS